MAPVDQSHMFTHNTRFGYPKPQGIRCGDHAGAERLAAWVLFTGYGFSETGLPDDLDPEYQRRADQYHLFCHHVPAGANRRKDQCLPAVAGTGRQAFQMGAVSVTRQASHQSALLLGCFRHYTVAARPTGLGASSVTCAAARYATTGCGLSDCPDPQSVPYSPAELDREHEPPGPDQLPRANPALHTVVLRLWLRIQRALDPLDIAILRLFYRPIPAWARR